MEQHFKFGDKVWHGAYGVCVVISVHDDFIRCISKDLSYVDFYVDRDGYFLISELIKESDWIKVSLENKEHVMELKRILLRIRNQNT